MELVLEGHHDDDCLVSASCIQLNPRQSHKMDSPGRHLRHSVMDFVADQG